jgi:hypothetical protein
MDSLSGERFWAGQNAGRSGRLEGVRDGKRRRCNRMQDGTVRGSKLDRVLSPALPAPHEHPSVFGRGAELGRAAERASVHPALHLTVRIAELQLPGNATEVGVSLTAPLPQASLACLCGI